MPKYCIIRFYQFQVTNEVRETGLTLEEARAHCNDPSTRGPDWVDGYEEEQDRRKS